MSLTGGLASRPGERGTVRRSWPTVLAGSALAFVLAAWAVSTEGRARTRLADIAAFATSLEGRTRSQRHNAVRAARELNGAVIPPDGIFSFNRTVRSWSIDNGYVRAPVSFNGELVPAFGGGVCQVSTTLYNAALLSGLEIVERHRHVFVPGYIAAGRDAAVAHPDLDLRIRNPYPVPVAIVAACEGDRILVRLRCSARPAREFALVTEALGRTSSRDILVRRDGGSSRSLHRFRGAPGGRVVTYRTVTEGGREVRRERLSDDTYPAMRGISPLPEALP